MTARGCPLFFMLLVALAWGTLFIPMPKWLAGVLSVLFVAVGCVIVVMGWAGATWDSHMQPGATHAKWGLAAGVLVLLSRAKAVVWLIAQILTAPPSPPML